MDLTVGQFVYVIRKRIKLRPEKAIFIFVSSVLPPSAALMSSIYEEHRDEDGFLYIQYSGEHTFGDEDEEEDVEYEEEEEGYVMCESGSGMRDSAAEDEEQE